MVKIFTKFVIIFVFEIFTKNESQTELAMFGIVTKIGVNLVITRYASQIQFFVEKNRFEDEKDGLKCVRDVNYMKFLKRKKWLGNSRRI